MTSSHVYWNNQAIESVNCFQKPREKDGSVKNNQNKTEHYQIMKEEQPDLIHLNNQNRERERMESHMALVVHARSWTISNAACNMNWCRCAASSF